jgi:4-hydroxy-2-oxoheptanedioate aldolase
MMRENRLKRMLQAGETAVGVFQPVPASAMTEVFGLVGFDFVILDAEHGPSAVETCEAMIRAADAVDLPTVVRIAENTSQNILRYLDAGALGVQIPMVNNASLAQAVVDSVKYPPVGKRGLAAVRANGFGLTGPLGDYTRQANAETVVVVQVETREAIDNLDAILAVDGIDVVFVGPNDLSTSLGYPGEPNNPIVQEIIGDLIERIHKAGKISGTIAYDSEAIARVRARGIRYVAGGAVPLLASASRAYLREMRAPAAPPVTV